jgi:hypothetical protein
MMLLRQKVKRAAAAAGIAHRLAHASHHGRAAAAGPRSPGSRDHEHHLLKNLLAEGQCLEDLDEEELQELMQQVSEMHGDGSGTQGKPSKMVSVKGAFM